MNVKSFLSYIEEINELKKLPNTFWNKRKLRKALKRLDKQIRLVAQIEADKMFNQVYDFYNNLIDKNLD